MFYLSMAMVETWISLITDPIMQSPIAFASSNVRDLLLKNVHC